MFIVSRSHGAPAPTLKPEEVGVRVFTQLWQVRQQPYDSLSDGDTLYWADQETREIRWELRVRNVRRARCTGMLEYAGYLRNWFGVLEPETEYGSGRERRWLLAWENELVQPIGTTLPDGFKLGRNGFRPIDQHEHAALRLPPLGRSALLPVEPVNGPVAVFGPGARRTIPSHVRTAVFARDGHRCQNRNCSTTTGPFHLDHIHPFSKGGPSTLENLQVLCASCNLSKGARTTGDIDELLLPDSALPRLLVSAGMTQPDTVSEAADALADAVGAGTISVQDAALAVLSSLGDLNWDHDYCAELASAFGTVGSPDGDAWFRLIDCLAVTYENMEMVNGLWEDFEHLLARPGLIGDTAAAVVAPSLVLAQLFAVQFEDESAPEIENIQSRAPHTTELIARGRNCPDRVTARRVRPLEFLDLHDRVRQGTARYEDINSLFGHLTTERSPVDPLAYHAAMLVLATWFDETGDDGALDAAIECAIAATGSLHAPAAADSCRWVAHLAGRRGSEGDAELAEFYVRMADSIEATLPVDHGDDDVER